MPEKPRRDLAAGELEFTDDKVRRVGLMFLLLVNFVEWGNGGRVPGTSCRHMHLISRMHAS